MERRTGREGIGLTPALLCGFLLLYASAFAGRTAARAAGEFAAEIHAQYPAGTDEKRLVRALTELGYARAGGTARSLERRRYDPPLPKWCAVSGDRWQVAWRADASGRIIAFDRAEFSPHIVFYPFLLVLMALDPAAWRARREKREN